MKIEQIDVNFSAKNIDDGREKDYYSIPDESFSLFGLNYSEKEGGFYRVPGDIAEKTNAGVEALARNTSGGRLCFSTNSEYLSITVAYEYLCKFAHMSLTGTSGFSLFEKNDYGYNFVASLHPGLDDEKGFFADCALPGGKMHDYVLFFPLYNDVDSLVVALEKGSFVESFNPYKAVFPVVYYGSSITQGACASRPDNCYQAFASKWTNIDFLNFGFSGSAKGEEVMAEYLSSIPASLFVMDYDHNAPDTEWLKRTHYNFYKKYRENNVATPILFISRPDYKHTPDGEERLRIIKSTYKRAKKEGDEKVWLLSGEKLYGATDDENCSVDGCHPNDLGFYRIAKKVLKKIKEICPDYFALK